MKAVKETMSLNALATFVNAMGQAATGRYGETGNSDITVIGQKTFLLRQKYNSWDGTSVGEATYKIEVANIKSIVNTNESVYKPISYSSKATISGTSIMICSIEIIFIFPLTAETGVQFSTLKIPVPSQEHGKYLKELLEEAAGLQS